jgi:hypothetical protein
VTCLPHGEDGELQVLDNPRDCGAGDGTICWLPHQSHMHHPRCCCHLHFLTRL